MECAQRNTEFQGPQNTELWAQRNTEFQVPQNTEFRVQRNTEFRVFRITNYVKSEFRRNYFDGIMDILGHTHIHRYIYFLKRSEVLLLYKKFDK